MGASRLCSACSALCHANWIDNVKQPDFTWTTRSAPGTSWSPFSRLGALPYDQQEGIRPEQLLGHLSGAELERSARDGCHLCYLINVQVEHRKHSEPEEFSRIRRSSVCRSELQPRTSSQEPAELVFIYCSERYYDRVRVRLDYKPGDDGLWKTDVTDLKRRNIVDPVMSWIKECLASHDTCRQNSTVTRKAVGTSSQPARFLEVLADESGLSKMGVRLVESRSLPSGFRYAALSHCWGPHGCPIQLKTYNQAEFLKVIDFDLLPRTFAEAVVYTVKLGLRYLWIDALCIIQDSKDDWARESTKMCAVYSQSHVTLAATGSSDGRGGLFCQESNELANACILDATFQGTGLPGGRWLADIPYRDNHYVEKAPLNTRAWVLQEALLAPRTVAFSRDRVRWYCASDSDTEAGRPARKLTSSSFQDAEPWTTIIDRYSRLGITKRTDKLAAISGLAQVYAHMSGFPRQDYLAGLWRQSLLRDLSWKMATDAQLPKSVEHDYIAPSWSWAARGMEIQLAVNWDSMVPDPNLEVVEAVVDPPAQFGPLKGGYLEFVGKLHPCTLHDTNSVGMWGQSYEDRGPMILTSGTASVSLDIPSTAGRDVTSCFFLILTTSELSYNMPLPSDGTLVNGLLLKAVEYAPGMYERMGTLQITFYGVPDEELPWKSHAARLDATQYIDACGSERYKFRVI